MKVYKYGTDFYTDIKRGKVGEDLFKKNFLDFLEIDYVDVTGRQQYQVIDTDFKAKIGTYEVKTNYKDDRQLVIEEYTNIDDNLCPISVGWFYKTSADLLVFVSKKTEVMVLVPFTEKFKCHYENIKNEYELIHNRPTIKGSSSWVSAFRRIPLDSINGYYSMYKRIWQLEI